MLHARRRLASRLCQQRLSSRVESADLEERLRSHTTLLGHIRTIHRLLSRVRGLFTLIAREVVRLDHLKDHFNQYTAVSAPADGVESALIRFRRLAVLRTNRRRFLVQLASRASQHPDGAMILWLSLGDPIPVSKR